ncbi:MAG: tetratricopeptide repeat protein [Cytophagales bacterium]|nr:tetratricopeptide repeat protein [Cytophagales bacterium]MCA6370754.1 tetratricopeptide repeat protein [Cytophagales bacterium]MCA6385916.1 tetratricopeptide repeat protein [Cytophagales bacterium]
MVKSSWIILFITLINFLNGFGQNASVLKIDSLESLIKLKSGAEKFDAMLGLIRIHFTKNPKTALALSQQAEALAFSIGDSLRIVKAMYATGFIYRSLDSVVQSIRVLEDALPIAKRNNYNVELSKILNSIAIGYTFNGKSDKALEFHFQGIDLNERLGNKEDMAITYNNIGLVYFKLSDYENALRFYQKSLDLKTELKDLFDLDVLYVNMALCYNQLRRYKEAEEFIRRSMQSCKGGCNPSIQMDIEIAMGVALMQQGRAEEGIPHFESSLRIARQLNDTRHQLDNLTNIADAIIRLGDGDKAISLLIEAEKIAKNTAYPTNLLTIYRRFYRGYSLKKDSKNASIYLSKYTYLQDSIFSAEIVKNLSEAGTKISDRELLKIIESKDDVLEHKQQLIKQKSIQFTTLVVVTLVTISLSILLLRARRKIAHTIEVMANSSNKKKI